MPVRIFRSLLYHPSPLVEVGAVAAVILAAVLIFTLPLILHINQAIPQGSEPEAVALFQLFSAEWTGFVLDRGISYWDAPFFYPLKGIFSWCEPQPFTCVLIWLLAKGVGYISAYNLVVLFYLVGLGLAGYATTRILSNDRLSCLWVGLWLAVGAFSLQQICALPLLAYVFVAGCLFFVLLYNKNKQARFFWLALFYYILSWLTFKQGALYLSLILLLVLTVFFRRPRFHLSRLLRWLAALAAVILCVVPFLLSQRRASGTMGLSRPITDVSVSLRWSELLMPANGHWLASRILGLKLYSWDIGIVPLIAIGIAVSLGFLKSWKRHTFEYKAILGLVAIALFSLVLGPGARLSVSVAGRRFGIYQLFFNLIPGMDLIRAPVRIIFFAIFSVGVVSGLALAFVRSKLLSSAARLLITFLFFALLAAEMWCVPLPLVWPQKAIEAHRPVDNWLHSYANQQPLVELPSPVKLWPDNINYEVEAMRRSLRHGCPIVNGYASFASEPFYQLRVAFEQDPQGRAIRYLEALGVRFVLLHLDRLSAGQEGNYLSSIPGDVVYQDAGHRIYALPEREAVLDPRKFLPQQAVVKQTLRKDKVYSLGITKARGHAMLIIPDKDWQVNLEWPQVSGGVQWARLRLYGSVILDSHDGEIFFRVRKISKNNKVIEAQLVPGERLKLPTEEKDCLAR